MVYVDLRSRILCATHGLNSNITVFKGNTTGVVTVECSAGYTSNSSTQFSATCKGTAPGLAEWFDLVTCEPVPCDLLTVASSNTTNISGDLFHTVDVLCDNGYNSTGGASFVATCEAISPGVSEANSFLL